MTKKRIYISGPMTGLPGFNFPAFHAAAAKIRAQGFDVFNPAESVVDTSGTWEEFMRHDLKALCDCHSIALLPGWQKSRGAHLEVYVAHQLGIDVIDAAIFDAAPGELDARHNAELTGDPQLYRGASSEQSERG